MLHPDWHGEEYRREVARIKHWSSHRSGTSPSHDSGVDIARSGEHGRAADVHGGWGSQPGTDRVTTNREEWVNAKLQEFIGFATDLVVREHEPASLHQLALLLLAKSQGRHSLASPPTSECVLDGASRVSLSSCSAAGFERVLAMAGDPDTPDELSALGMSVIAHFLRCVLLPCVLLGVMLVGADCACMQCREVASDERVLHNAQRDLVARGCARVVLTHMSSQSGSAAVTLAALDLGLQLLHGLSDTVRDAFLDVMVSRAALGNGVVATFEAQILGLAQRLDRATGVAGMGHADATGGANLRAHIDSSMPDSSPPVPHLPQVRGGRGTLGTNVTDDELDLLCVQLRFLQVCLWLCVCGHGKHLIAYRASCWRRIMQISKTGYEATTRAA